MSKIATIIALAGTGVLVHAATQSYPVIIESVEGSTVHAAIPELDYREVTLTPEEIVLESDYEEFDFISETGFDDFSEDPDNIIEFPFDPVHRDWAGEETEVA